MSSPLLGFRAFSQSGDGWVGAYRGHRWEAGPNQAECGEANDHLSPDPGCHCGMYAYHSPAKAADFQGPVVAAVIGWGRVCVHSDRWRSQYAQVIAVLQREQLSEQAGRFFGVPVLPFSQFWAYSQEFGELRFKNGVPPWQMAHLLPEPCSDLVLWERSTLLRQRIAALKTAGQPILPPELSGELFSFLGDVCARPDPLLAHMPIATSEAAMLLLEWQSRTAALTAERTFEGGPPVPELEAPRIWAEADLLLDLAEADLLRGEGWARAELVERLMGLLARMGTPPPHPLTDVSASWARGILISVQQECQRWMPARWPENIHPGSRLELVRAAAERGLLIGLGAENRRLLVAAAGLHGQPVDLPSLATILLTTPRALEVQIERLLDRLRSQV